MLIHHWQGCKIAQPLGKTVWWFLTKLNTELPIDSLAKGLTNSTARYTLLPGSWQQVFRQRPVQQSSCNTIGTTQKVETTQVNGHSV